MSPRAPRSPGSGSPPARRRGSSGRRPLGWPVALALLGLLGSQGCEAYAPVPTPADAGPDAEPPDAGDGGDGGAGGDAGAGAGAGGQGGAGGEGLGGAGGAGGAGGEGGGEPRCDDGLENGDESDTDCGGSCAPCGDGLGCGEPADCASGVCLGGACVAPSCADDVANGGESDVDCGGPCAPCLDGGQCAGASDCLSGVCDGTGHCAAPACDDGTDNGLETDLDCGGLCPPCADGLSCGVAADCASGLCQLGTCIPSVTLTVQLIGSGHGTVFSSPPGVACTGTCAVLYPLGTALALAGSKSPGSTFQGFGGPCVGTGSCDLLLSADTTVTASFWGGAVLHVGAFGGPGTEWNHALATSGDGVTVVGGAHDATSDFGAGAEPVPGVRSAFVASYVGTTASWSQSFGAVGGDARALGVGLVPGGDVLVTGAFSGAVDLGAGPLVSAGGDDVFVARLSGATGALLWARALGGPGDERGLTVAAQAGAVLVGGSFASSGWDVGGPLLTPAGGEDGFVLWLDDTTGATAAAFSWGGGADDRTASLAPLPSGDIALAGSFEGAGDLAGWPLAFGGGTDLVVARVSPAGLADWVLAAGGAGDEQAGSASYGSGKLFVGGQLGSSGLDLGLGPWAIQGATDGVILALDPATGAPQWQHALVGADAERVEAVAASPGGGVAFAGVAWSTSVDFGAGSQPGFLGGDAFAGKLAPDGGHLWSYFYGGAAYDGAHGVGVDDMGVVHVSGDVQDFWVWGPGPEEHVHDFGGGRELFLLELAP